MPFIIFFFIDIILSFLLKVKNSTFSESLHEIIANILSIIIKIAGIIGAIAPGIAPLKILVFYYNMNSAICQLVFILRD